MEENNVAQENKSKEKKNRSVLIFVSFLIITGGLAIWLLITNSRLTKSDASYNTLSAKYTSLSDSVREITTTVNDSLAPIVFKHDSYIAQFKDSFKTVNNRLSGQKKEVLSYVNSMRKQIKTATEDVESFRSNQVSFSSLFNKDLQEVKTKYDSLSKTKVTSYFENLNSNPLNLVNTTDTCKNNTVEIDNSKKTKQKNGGHGGQKRLRFNKIFGTPNTEAVWH